MGMGSITSLTMSGDLTNSGGDILLTSSATRAITHTGGWLHTGYFFNWGSVVVESVCSLRQYLHHQLPLP